MLPTLKRKAELRAWCERQNPSHNAVWVADTKQVIYPCRSKTLDTINVSVDGTVELVYTDGYIDING